MKIRKALAFLMAFCVLLAVTPEMNAALADAVVLNSTGSFNSFMITFDNSRGLLTVEGQGKIPDVSNENASPWAEYRNMVKLLYIGEGITDIGSRAFAGMNNLTTVTFPGTIRNIDEEAFLGDRSVTSIKYTGTMTYLQEIIEINEVDELMLAVQKATGVDSLISSQSAGNARTTTTRKTNTKTTTTARGTSTGRTNNNGGGRYSSGRDDGGWSDPGPQQNQTPENTKDTDTKKDSEKKDSEKDDTKKDDTKKDDTKTDKDEKDKSSTSEEDYVKKDEQGRVTEAKETQKDGTVKVSNITYDEQGNVAEAKEQTLDADGNVIAENTKTTTVDSKGNKTVTESNKTYDEDGKTTGTESKSETYDAEGKKTAESWSDSKGNSHEATYDANGKETSSKDTTVKKGVTEVETRQVQDDGITTTGTITRTNQDGSVQHEEYIEEVWDNGHSLIRGQVTDDEGNELGAYSSNIRETDDGYVEIFNQYGTIGNETVTKYYDNDGNFLYGVREWDNNMGKGGQSQLDEQGREVSGYIQDGGAYDEFEYTYNEDGTVTKTGTYSAYGDKEIYTETTSKDEMSTTRTGTIEKNNGDTYKFVETTDYEDDGGYTTERKETDSEGTTIGKGQTVDASGTVTAATESWEDKTGNGTSTNFDVTYVTDEEGKQKAVYTTTGGTVTEVKKEGVVEESYTYTLDENASEWTPTSRSGKTVTTQSNGTVSVDEYTRTYNDDGLDEVKGTVVTTTKDGETQTDEYTVETDREGTVTNRRGTITNETTGVVTTYTNEYAETETGKTTKLTTTESTGKIFNNEIIYDAETDTEIQNQYYKNPEDGTERTTVEVNNRVVSGTQKDGTSYEEYTVEYSGNTTTRTTFRTLDADGSKQKITTVKNEETGDFTTTTIREKQDGGYIKEVYDSTTGDSTFMDSDGEELNPANNADNTGDGTGEDTGTNEETQGENAAKENQTGSENDTQANDAAVETATLSVNQTEAADESQAATASLMMMSPRRALSAPLQMTETDLESEVELTDADTDLTESELTASDENAQDESVSDEQDVTPGNVLKVTLRTFAKVAEGEQQALESRIKEASEPASDTELEDPDTDELQDPDTDGLQNQGELISGEDNPDNDPASDSISDSISEPDTEGTEDTQTLLTADRRMSPLNRTSPITVSLDGLGKEVGDGVEEAADTAEEYDLPLPDVLKADTNSVSTPVEVTERPGLLSALEPGSENGGEASGTDASDDSMTDDGDESAQAAPETDDTDAAPVQETQTAQTAGGNKAHESDLFAHFAAVEENIDRSDVTEFATASEKNGSNETAEDVLRIDSDQTVAAAKVDSGIISGVSLTGEKTFVSTTTDKQPADEAQTAAETQTAETGPAAEAQTDEPVLIAETEVVGAVPAEDTRTVESGDRLMSYWNERNQTGGQENADVSDDASRDETQQVDETQTKPDAAPVVGEIVTADTDAPNESVSVLDYWKDKDLTADVQPNTDTEDTAETETVEPVDDNQFAEPVAALTDDASETDGGPSVLDYWKDKEQALSGNTETEPAAEAAVERDPQPAADADSDIELLDSMQTAVKDVEVEESSEPVSVMDYWNNKEPAADESQSDGQTGLDNPDASGSTEDGELLDSMPDDKRSSGSDGQSGTTSAQEDQNDGEQSGDTSGNEAVSGPDTSASAQPESVNTAAENRTPEAARDSSADTVSEDGQKDEEIPTVSAEDHVGQESQQSAGQSDDGIVYVSAEDLLKEDDRQSASQSDGTVDAVQASGDDGTVDTFDSGANGSLTNGSETGDSGMSDSGTNDSGANDSGTNGSEMTVSGDQDGGGSVDTQVNEEGLVIVDAETFLAETERVEAPAPAVQEETISSVSDAGSSDDLYETYDSYNSSSYSGGYGSDGGDQGEGGDSSYNGRRVKAMMLVNGEWVQVELDANDARLNGSDPTVRLIEESPAQPSGSSEGSSNSSDSASDTSSETSSEASSDTSSDAGTGPEQTESAESGTEPAQEQSTENTQTNDVSSEPAAVSVIEPESFVETISESAPEPASSESSSESSSEPAESQTEETQSDDQGSGETAQEQ